MSDIAMRVEGLSKLYQLGATEYYRTLRDTLTDTFLAPFRRMRRGASPREEAAKLVVAAAALAASLTTAYLLYRWVEKPCQRYAGSLRFQKEHE